MSDMEIPIIQWEVKYDGWQLLKAEIQYLLRQISHGAGKLGTLQSLGTCQDTNIPLVLWPLPLCLLTIRFSCNSVPDN